MKYALKYIISCTVLLGNAMGELNINDVINLTDAKNHAQAEKIVNKVNQMPKSEQPYEIIEHAWPLMREEKYEKAALWICLAMEHGYDNGEAINGFIDDWETSKGNIDGIVDFLELIKEKKNHPQIAGTLAKFWKKKYQKTKKNK